MIKKYCFLFITILVWLFALFNGTGLGNAYDTNGKLVLLTIGIAALLLIHDKKIGIQIPTKLLISGLFVISIFLLSPLLKRGQTFTIDYLYVFFLVYIFSKIKIKRKYIEWTSYVYGVLGLGILYIYTETSILKGWNENTIAMVGFFSYTIFCIAFFDNLTNFRLVLFLATSGIYLSLVEQTDSRTSTVCIVVYVLIILLRCRLNKPIKLENNFRILLNIPLLVAVAVTMISGTPLAKQLDRWSLENFLKPAFNGRDEIWLEGFRVLKSNFFIGSGKLQSGYWHNSAIACLTAYGLLGYMSWISFLKNILLLGKKHLEDSLVQGCMISFLIIFAHQSFELGFIAPDPNLIPYMCMGILLGRVRCLESGVNHE